MNTFVKISLTQEEGEENNQGGSAILKVWKEVE